MTHNLIMLLVCIGSTPTAHQCQRRNSRSDNNNFTRFFLQENLDSLSSQLSAAQRGWEDESSAAHQKYESLLSEFGLNARNIWRLRKAAFVLMLDPYLSSLWSDVASVWFNSKWCRQVVTRSFSMPVAHGWVFKTNYIRPWEYHINWVIGVVFTSSCGASVMLCNSH